MILVSASVNSFFLVLFLKLYLLRCLTYKVDRNWGETITPQNGPKTSPSFAEKARDFSGISWWEGPHLEDHPRYRKVDRITPPLIKP